MGHPHLGLASIGGLVSPGCSFSFSFPDELHPASDDEATPFFPLLTPLCPSFIRTWSPFPCACILRLISFFFFVRSTLFLLAPALPLDHQLSFLVSLYYDLDSFSFFSPQRPDFQPSLSALHCLLAGSPLSLSSIRITEAAQHSTAHSLTRKQATPSTSWVTLTQPALALRSSTDRR